MKNDKRTTYGYCRVSTTAQNEDRQVEAMKKLGIKEKDIIIEKASGKDFDRPQYKRLTEMLRKGDLLYLGSIDRLGRNYDEIISQWQFLVKDMGVDIVVLDMPVLDTRKDNDVTGHLISDIVLQLLSYVAHKERESILTRQAEGIALAKARGVRFGRKPIGKPRRFPELYNAWSSGNITATDAAKILGVSRQTFTRWCAGA